MKLKIGTLIEFVDYPKIWAWGARHYGLAIIEANVVENGWCWVCVRYPSNCKCSIIRWSPSQLSEFVEKGYIKVHE